METAVIDPETQQPIELKDRGLAAVLAWLVPGLGHIYQGRHAKGGLFAVCILGLFFYGVYLGGDSEVGWGRTVYFAKSERLPYFLQVWVGVPAMPALVQAARTEGEPLWNGFMAPPRPQRNEALSPRTATLHDVHYRLDRYFELSSVFTMIAGLLNVLAIYDAFAGPFFTEPKKDEKDKKAADDKKSADPPKTSNPAAPTPAP